jgi:AcrR family transcriptional regulator
MTAVVDPTPRDEAAIEPTSRGPGRPRRAEVDDAILHAVVELLGEVGYDELTIEHVAARAKVGKATIYRRWSSKSDLVVDAVGMLKATPVAPDTGTTRGDLVAFLSTGFNKQDETMVAETVVGLCMEMQRNPETADLYRERLVEPRRAVGREILERGVERGEVRPDFDPVQVMDQLAGPLFYRRLIGDGPIDQPFIESVVDSVLAGLAPSISR